MKRLVRCLVRLYPATWRERYAIEFETLLEDSEPGVSGIFDLIQGAVKMHFALPSFPKLALLLSAAGLLAGFGVSFLVTPRYVSSATIEFEPPAGSTPGNFTDLAMQMQREILSRTSLADIIQEPRLNLYESERASMALLDVIERMRKEDLDIRITPPGPLITINFSYRDATKAHDTTQAVVTKFVESNLTRQRIAAHIKQKRSATQMERMEARIAALEKRLGLPPEPRGPVEEFIPALDGITIAVLDPPSLPAKPIFPDRFQFIAAGFASGFGLAVVIAIFRRRPQPAIPFPAATA